MHVYWNTQKGKSVAATKINVSLFWVEFIENVKFTILLISTYDGVVYN